MEARPNAKESTVKMYVSNLNNDANTQIESKINPVNPIDAFEIDRDDIPF